MSDEYQKHSEAVNWNLDFGTSDYVVFPDFGFIRAY
jgi:hypothetical protein